VKIRFQADADLNQFIVVGVQRREPDIDFRTAKDARLRGLKDSEVLEIAARDNRILISQDFKTMPAAFARFLDEHTSPGVFIVPQSMERESADDLDSVRCCRVVESNLQTASVTFSMLPENSILGTRPRLRSLGRALPSSG
jgi:hypothetical protein